MPSSSTAPHQTEHIEFCDLSAEIDRTLKFIALMSESPPCQTQWGDSAVYGEFIWDYLGKRAALEHVFFNRYVGGVRWDELKLKAEIWRIKKIRAKAQLFSKSGKKPNRSGSGQ